VEIESFMDKSNYLKLSVLDWGDRFFPFLINLATKRGDAKKKGEKAMIKRRF